MDADERDILTYLKGYPGQFVSGREIARRASGKKRFQKEPDWAIPVLTRLVDKSVLESDSTGHFRIKPVKKEKKIKWLSPQIQQILQKSGKKFEGVIQVDEEEAKDDFDI